MALVAAVSDDCGLEGYALYPKSISTTEFVAFVESLSAKFGGSEFCMFMDNLQVYKTNKVVDTC